jgi:hypothetical protein
MASQEMAIIRRRNKMAIMGVFDEIASQARGKTKMARNGNNGKSVARRFLGRKFLGPDKRIKGNDSIGFGPEKILDVFGRKFVSSIKRKGRSSRRRYPIYP